MNAELPRWVRRTSPSGERVYDDSLFRPTGYVFPEVRDQLWPHRAFPLPLGSEPPADATLEVQQMGLQYCVHVQMCREPGLQLTAPAEWSTKQRLWTDLPVFTEEACEWHYPRVQVGYNVGQTDPPMMLRPEVNVPQYLGYLPNGDLLVYWELAELLAEEFGVELEAVPSSLDGRALIVGLGVDEDVLLSSPVGAGVDVGIVLSRAELRELDAARAFIAEMGGQARVFAPCQGSMFYRLVLPVMQVEWDMNRYVSATWDALDIECQRLASFDFRVVDTPRVRSTHLFATEHGNLVVSLALHERLLSALGPHGVSSCGQLLPLVRIP